MRAVLVTGGSGTLGRHVVARLAELGGPVRVLSRRPRAATADTDDRAMWVVGDLARGNGIRAALDGVEAIVHCASDPRTKGAEVRATGNLVDAALAMQHRPTLVYISIVGVDRVPLRYYREKHATERLIESSGLPWTILRTTQFHELVAFLAARAARASPVIPVPARTSVQPIDAGEVAQRLVELAGEPPRGRVADMGGPAVRSAADLVRAYLRAVGKARLVVPVYLPGAVGRGYRDGGHLAPDRAVGATTFDQFVDRAQALGRRSGLPGGGM